jgi:hypothetical protein
MEQPRPGSPGLEGEAHSASGCARARQKVRGAGLGSTPAWGKTSERAQMQTSSAAHPSIATRPQVPPSLPRENPTPQSFHPSAAPAPGSPTWQPAASSALAASSACALAEAIAPGELSPSSVRSTAARSGASALSHRSASSSAPTSPAALRAT